MQPLLVSFRSIALPVFVNKLILLLVLVSETFFLSKVSNDAVVGVSSALPLIYGCVTLIGAFASMTTSRLGRAIGESNEEKVKRAFSAGLCVCLACGLILMIAQISVAPYLGSWLGLNSAASEAAKLYIYGISPMCLLDGLFLTFTSFLYVRGIAKKSLLPSAILLLCSTIINFVLLYGIIPGLTLEPLTIALSTLIAQLPPLIMLAIQLYKSGGMHLQRDLRFDAGTLKYARSIVRDGLPACAEPVSANLLILCAVSLISPFGAFTLAALSYCRNVMLILVTATSGAVGLATQVLVSRAQGSNDFSGADRVMQRSINRFIPVLLLTLVIVALLSQFSGGIISIFTSDEAVLKAASSIFAIMIFSETAKALNFIIGPSLRGSSDVRLPTTFAVISHWVVGFLLAYILSHHFGFVGVLLGLACDEAARCLFNFIRWKAGNWKINLQRDQAV